MHFLVNFLKNIGGTTSKLSILNELGATRSSHLEEGGPKEDKIMHKSLHNKTKNLHNKSFLFIY